jgi:hypothetical protein
LGSKAAVGVFLSVRLEQKCVTTSVAVLVEIIGMYTDYQLAHLAWSLIRDWRRRRDVDPAIRRARARLYVGVTRRVRRGRAEFYRNSTSSL